MKNLILISDDTKNEFDNIEELKKFILSNLYNATNEEQQKFFYEKVFGFSIINRLQIVDTLKGVYESNYQINEKEIIKLEKAIVINNFDTYILSLCKFNIIVLLEEENHRYYTKDIINTNDKYIVVNAFADKILRKIVGDIK